ELYLALGDSLGVGLFASAPETRGYVAQFHALLERSAGRPVALENLSVSGETARSLLTGGQLDRALRTIAEARANGWRVSPITIDIGGNDMRALQGANDAAREAGLAEFRGNVARIFDALVAATSEGGARQSDILTMTVYNPYAGDPTVSRSLAWWVERFNAALAEEAARRDIPVAPVYERFRGQERALTNMPLDFHANNAGHRAIAEAFWGASGYDQTAPALEIVEPDGALPPRAVPTIKVRAADDLGVARVEFLIDDRPLPPPVYKADLDLYIGYWDARAAPPGPHRLSVLVADAAGNTARRDLTVTR
ncbi:MAG: GDSL-type esterase/lipase family protein, partial [Chloroflexota bacterium]|nr:GDSL-type esterase/lipase family protein [Chloroflexota bacterium]